MEYNSDLDGVVARLVAYIHVSEFIYYQIKFSLHMIDFDARFVDGGV